MASKNRSPARRTVLLRSLKTRGVGRTVRMIVEELTFDLLRGCDTSGFIPADRLDVGQFHQQHAVQYQPVPPCLLRALLRRLPMPIQTVHLVDFGCGKGRALIIAAEWGIPWLSGVDISEQLCAIAQRNLLRISHQKAGQFHADIQWSPAQDYAISPQPNVFLFYNPFHDRILSLVLDNIDRSIRDFPRPAALMYLGPTNPPVLDDRYPAIYRLPHEGVIYAVGSP